MECCSDLYVNGKFYQFVCLMDSASSTSRGGCFEDWQADNNERGCTRNRLKLTNACRSSLIQTHCRVWGSELKRIETNREAERQRENVVSQLWVQISLTVAGLWLSLSSYTNTVRVLENRREAQLIYITHRAAAKSTSLWLCSPATKMMTNHFPPADADAWTQALSTRNDPILSTKWR